MQPELPSDLIAGADLRLEIDILFVNAPLRDYDERPRVNDFTLPVLGMAYIATYAAAHGFNVGVLDAEAHGLGIAQTARLVNAAAPRWVGFNLLAPTYEISARIAERLDRDIMIMLGGHQAKAMPAEILLDQRMSQCEALVIGEGETRVAALLDDHKRRTELPGVMWLDPIMRTPVTGGIGKNRHHLAPDINALPFVDRGYLTQDPHRDNGRLEANMVGARGCPYDCSFCGAAVSANPGYHHPHPRAAQHPQRDGRTSRHRSECFPVRRRPVPRRPARHHNDDDRVHRGPRRRLGEVGRHRPHQRAEPNERRHARHSRRERPARGRARRRVRQRADACPDRQAHHSRHGALGGAAAHRARDQRQGLFHPGVPTETCAEIDDTVRLVHDLWDITDPLPGRFRASAFEYRPYPGTPDWGELMKSGKYTAEQLLNYSAVDLTSDGVDESMRERDEFNFSVNIQLSEAPIDYVQRNLVTVSRAQYDRKAAV